MDLESLERAKATSKQWDPWHGPHAKAIATGKAEAEANLLAGPSVDDYRPDVMRERRLLYRIWDRWSRLQDRH